MQSTNTSTEFEIMLQNVTHELNRHTGHAEFDKQTLTITACSQSQELKATIKLDITSNTHKYSYVVEIDGNQVTDQIHQDSLSRCHSHICGLVISQLGDKVVNSLL